MSSFAQRSIVREVLLWSAPALAVGFFLRAWLTWALPYGYLQFDSIDFLETPYYLLDAHKWVVNSKRSFLVPLTFTIPFYLHIPALLFIPLLQHFLGLVQIAFAGALVRFWFAKWQWFIVPVTLLVAISPWNLWFEHALMGEAQYLFLLFASALTGTLWARKPVWQRFVLFWFTAFLAACSRGEGKLFLVFPIVLVVFVLWRKWRPLAIHLAVSLVAAVIIFLSVKSPTNASTNLYVSLVHMAPDHFRSEPGIEPYLGPVRDQVKAQNLEYPEDSVMLAKRVQDAVDIYTKKIMPSDSSLKNQRRRGAKILNRLSLQIIRDHPVKALILPLRKFQLALDSWMSGDFDEHFLQDKQRYALKRNDWMENVLGQGLTGKKMSVAEFDRFVEEHYDPKGVTWFGKLADGWNDGLIFLRTPDQRLTRKRWVHDFHPGIKLERMGIPGVPLFYMLAVAGMLLAAFRPLDQRQAQLAWAIALLFSWYCVLTVGDTLPRYSVAYQPFCVLFFFGFFDWIAARFARKTSDKNATLRNSDRD
ncbi:MAG: hypothetical protein QOD99_1537 [Chthoniobacter sp.]|nr:hypothetical protein [Chthoniobacter sp.]